MAHFLVEPVNRTDQRLGRPTSTGLARRVAVRLVPPKQGLYDPSRSRRRRDFIARLVDLGVKLPNKVTDAVAELEDAEAMTWQGLGDLPELPTLVEESKSKFKKDKTAACSQAYRKLGEALADSGPTLYAQLGEKVAASNGSLAPLLRTAHTVRVITWGILQYEAGKRWKPARPGDPIWLVEDLAGWVADGAPKPTADGLFTPAEAIARIAELPTVTHVPPVEGSTK